ncbi:MAG: hypothetical protein R3F65_02180 [bacterium]|nr:hypothetical protein [Myxococcales bacterium]MCB9543091.1 hypothetical protein [Myxococcales bacterium]MCB9551625.1 hypothetical protein [Myxococcales bacterium]
MNDANGGDGMNGRKPDGNLQVSTDGWRAAMVSFEERRQEPERRPELERGAGPDRRQLSPRRELGVTYGGPLAVLLVAGEEAFDLDLSSGKTRTIPQETEHLYLRADFATAIEQAHVLDVRFTRGETFNAGGAAPAVRELIERTKSCYACPQGCIWEVVTSGALDSDAYVYHDGTIGVRFRVEGGVLVGIEWINRRPEALSASTLKDRQLTRQPLGEGPWFIGGHPVLRQTHPF